MPFELLENKGRRANLVPTVTFTREGAGINLSRAAYEHLGEPHHVCFFYNEETDQMAIEPQAPEEPGAYKVTDKKSIIRIHCGRILKDLGLTFEKFARYDANTDEEERLVLNLKDNPHTTRTAKNED